MPLVYTPTVGLGCQMFSLLFENPKGLFITINDKGHVYDILKVNTNIFRKLHQMTFYKNTLFDFVELA